jgi:hypothetical protein
MLDQMALMLETTWPALVTVYWVCFIVGGGLLVLSLLGGLEHHADADFDFHGDVDVDVDAGGVDVDHGIDLDHDADLDHDVDIGAHGSMLALSTWFSLRFVVFFVASFGMVGVCLSYLSDVTPGPALLVSAVAGLVVGQAVHQVFRAIRRGSGDSTVRAADYLNQPARVSIAIEPGKKGEVALVVAGGERFAPAVSQRKDAGFAAEDQVVVVDYRAGVAEVISREEYEFLNEGKKEV